MTFGLLIEQLEGNSDAYIALELAISLGLIVAMLFVVILFFVAFTRRLLFLAAQIRYVVIGSLFAAFVSVCCLLVIDVFLAEFLDRLIAGAIGDMVVPISATVLTTVSCYVGVLIATKIA